MEITIKVTDVKNDENADKAVENAMTALVEVGDIITEGNKKLKTLLGKGRKKIDLVGENCNLEISVKE